MTINITVVTPAFVIQASDRRMTDATTGLGIDDDGNKGLILQTDDGMFAITFNGIGRIRRRRVDEWLGERMAREGVAELPIEEGLEIVRKIVSVWFRSFPANTDKRHTFVFAGWRTRGDGPESVTWVVSNCLGADGRTRLPRPSSTFRVVERCTHRGRGYLWVDGAVTELPRAHIRRLVAAIKKGDLDRAEQAVVNTIRDAAANPQWQNAINGEVLSICVSPVRIARATYYPTVSNRENYAPLFVWYEGGKNMLAGDATITPSADKGFTFGSSVLVGKMGGQQSRNKLPESDHFSAKFRFFFSEAKHRTDPPGDGNVSIGGVVRLPTSNTKPEQITEVEVNPT